MLALPRSWGAKRCWWCVPAAYVGFVPILPVWGVQEFVYWSGCRGSSYGPAEPYEMLALGLVSLFVMIPLAVGAGRAGVRERTFLFFALLPSMGGSMMGFGVLGWNNAGGAQVLTPVLLLLVVGNAIFCSFAWTVGAQPRKLEFDGETCPGCRYDMRGLPALRCPECGWEEPAG